MTAQGKMKVPTAVLDKVPDPRHGSYPEELHPCPFCGASPQVIVQRAPEGLNQKPFIGVELIVQCESARCRLHPRFGMRGGVNSNTVIKGAVTATAYMRHEWIRHKAENRLWRKIKLIWNRRHHPTHAKKPK